MCSRMIFLRSFSKNYDSWLVSVYCEVNSLYNIFLLIWKLHPWIHDHFPSIFATRLWRIWHFRYACWRKDWNAGQWSRTPPPVGGLTQTKDEIHQLNLAYIRKKLTWKIYIKIWKYTLQYLFEKEKLAFSKPSFFSFHVYSFTGCIYKPNCGEIPLLN